MSIAQQEKYKVKKFLKELKQHKGRNTELVSVYIPSGYDINKILSHLNEEQGTAANIKSSSTRKNVISALERMIQHLKLFKQTPPNGLAIFSGNVAQREGQSDLQVWSIEPPMPLKTRIYRCDKDFVLEPLLDMIEDKEVYGLVVMDRRDADIAYLKGKSIVHLASASSNVPGKTRAGGQSAQRFERLREGAAKEFFNKIGEMVKDQFLENKDLKGIIVGGPGPTKHDFIDGNYITNELKKKIITRKDLSYTGKFGLQELVDNCEDVLAQEEVMKEKEILGKFFNLLARDPGFVEYGKDHVNDALSIGAVDKLLVSEELDDNYTEQLEKDAEKVGSELIIISTETREGIQLKEIGGIGAILRFRKENTT
ncbi:MAG: peptide chain release factor aRF-1 [Nanobdellota archaeon]